MTSLITCLCHYDDFTDDKAYFSFINENKNNKGILNKDLSQLIVT